MDKALAAVHILPYQHTFTHNILSSHFDYTTLAGMVWSELMKFVKDPKLLRRKVEEVLKERKDKTADKQEYERLAGLISKIEEEEQRYAKAYGVGTVEFEQFRDLMRDAKKRKLVFQTQFSGLKAKSDEEGLDKVEVDDIYYEAKKVLDDIDYSNKFISVRTLLDKVTIKEGGWVNVCGHIPLFAQKLGYEPESRNSRNTNKQSEPIIIPFELKFRLPKLRKSRIIFDRDDLGRIIHSKPPISRLTHP